MRFSPFFRFFILSLSSCQFTTLALAAATRRQRRNGRAQCKRGTIYFPSSASPSSSSMASVNKRLGGFLLLSFSHWDSYASLQILISLQNCSIYAEGTFSYQH